MSEKEGEREKERIIRQNSLTSILGKSEINHVQVIYRSRLVFCTYVTLYKFFQRWNFIRIFLIRRIHISFFYISRVASPPLLSASSAAIHVFSLYNFNSAYDECTARHAANAIEKKIALFRRMYFRPCGIEKRARAQSLMKQP